MTDERRTLYPELEPFNQGHLPVDGTHEIYFEECGNPQGVPAVFVHGGPGGGTDSSQRRFWDPQHYRVILFDQRGCGQSRPHASLENNTTWHLVEDIERLRTHLGIEKWQVFGGSWGSTLSLAYAQKYPSRVTELVLRGIFLMRPRELRWFYQEGASNIFPDAWEGYVAPIPEAERSNLIEAYYKRLTGSDPKARIEAAKAWSVWEGSTSKLITSPELIAKTGEDQFAEAFARIECHFFINKGFLDSPNQLLENIDTIRHIPATIVQGRYDVVCPVQTAWELHRAWPEADFEVIADAGHSATEPGIVDALVRATDRYRT